MGRLVSFPRSAGYGGWHTGLSYRTKKIATPLGTSWRVERYAPSEVGTEVCWAHVGDVRTREAARELAGHDEQQRELERERRRNA